MPQRHQLSRRKGFRLPPNTVNVARPSRWGNPFTITGDWIVWAAVAMGFKGDAAGRQRACVALHRAWLTKKLPPIRRSRSLAGALSFDGGREIGAAAYVQGLAGAFSALYPMPTLPTDRPSLVELRGKDLACWCKPGDPCHADTLLELANPAGED